MLIGKDDRKKLGVMFDTELKREIELVAVVGNGPKDHIEFVKALVTELGEITDKIKPKIIDLNHKIAKKYKIERVPTILIDPKNYNIIYTGAPVGEEGWSFIETLVLVSTDDSKLSTESRERLKGLKKMRYIRIFVTPMCPYCPQSVLLANQIAVEARDYVTSECIDVIENMDLAEKYNVRIVPTHVIDDKVTSIGVQEEARFVDDVVKG